MSKLKDSLIEEIKNSKNKELLEEIYQVLKDNENTDMVMLSDDQIKSIENAQNEFKEGKYFTQEQVDKEFDKWIEE